MFFVFVVVVVVVVVVEKRLCCIISRWFMTGSMREFPTSLCYIQHTHREKKGLNCYIMHGEWLNALFYFILLYFLFFGACTCALRMQWKKSIKIELGPFELEKVNIIFVESPVV